jgi:outer membrane protein
MTGALVFATGTPVIRRTIFVESIAMRLYQQIRASIARSAVAGAGLVVFVSGMPLSASGQTPPSRVASQLPPIASQPAPPGSPLAIEEAVRMALENNLNIQVEKLNPQIQVLGIARANAAYAPTLLTGLSRRNSTAPPQDFVTSAGTLVTTNSSFGSNAGLAQNVRWGGASYQVSFDGNRATSNQTTAIFNPSLGGNFNAVYTQPLLRNFKIDSIRQQLALSQIQATQADIQLQQRITQTSRNVRAAYYNLVGAIAGLDVAQQSLDVARTSLKNNQTRVEVGTMAQIDIVQAEAEVASNEEAVIVAQAQIETAQDQLRALVMNPNQSDFWTTRFTPSEEPTVTQKTIDVDQAIKAALQNRTDIRDFRKNMESTDVNMMFARNQKMPAIDLTARYGLTGNGGTQYSYGAAPAGEIPPILNTTQRGFGDVLHDVFGNDFKTWSFAVNVSYPLGTSQADAALAQTKLQKQQDQTTLANIEMGIATEVRQAGRDVNTNLRRIEATTRARELAQQRLDADNKRFSVGLATTFEVLQSQRDLSRAKTNELRAKIDYNLSLVNFEAVQIAPIR